MNVFFPSSMISWSSSILFLIPENIDIAVYVLLWYSRVSHWRASDRIIHRGIEHDFGPRPVSCIKLRLVDDLKTVFTQPTLDSHSRFIHLIESKSWTTIYVHINMSHCDCHQMLSGSSKWHQTRKGRYCKLGTYPGQPGLSTREADFE